MRFPFETLYNSLHSFYNHSMIIFSFLFSLFLNSAQAQCVSHIDLLVVGDSQTGATWSRSYTGDFLTECLQGNFVFYGRGGTIPANWLEAGGMDHIETVQRTPNQHHQIIGNKELVPLCKKRIEPMLAAHKPQKVLYQFGGNLITSSDKEIQNNIEQLMSVTVQAGIAPEHCYFLAPSFEMEVSTHRNVPARDLVAVRRVNGLILKAIKDRCTFIDGTELMKDSPFFDGKEYLKRILIEGKPGCGGKAINDNVHICGKSAQDLAERVCQLVN